MQIIKIAVLGLSLALSSYVAQAQPASAKGTASVSFSKFTPEVKQEALQKARVNAIDRYFAEGSDISKQDNYNLIRDSIVGNAGDYILGEWVINEDLDKKGKLYNIIVRVDLNVLKLENTLRASSSVVDTPNAEKSKITFIFVAREQSSVQSFDKKIYKREDTHDAENASAQTTDNSDEGERITRGNVKTTGSSDASKNVVRDTSVSITTGGSKTRKRDSVEWDVSDASDINKVVTGVLARAKFKVTPPGTIARKSGGMMNLDAIRKDYSRGSSLSEANQTNAALAARAAGMGYIAFGTVDVLMQDTDPATGLVRVTAKVNAEVLSLEDEDPVVVASVGPFTHAGLGSDESEARIAAMQKAATAAAQQLVNDLNAQNVR